MPVEQRSTKLNSGRIRTIIQVWLAFVMVASVFQMLPFDFSGVENASALSTWNQTSRTDFSTGTFEKVEIRGNGENAFIMLVSNEWFKKSPSSKPSPRTGHAMSTIYNQQKVLLFGGETNTGYSDETWIYDLINDVWTKKSPSQKPSGRVYHKLAPIHGTDKVVMFGGNSGMPGAETWIYDFSEDSWTQKNSMKKPTPRVGHAMASIYGEDKIVLFGGMGGVVNNETWIYDFSSNNWQEEFFSVKPSPRYGHAMATLIGTDEVLLFGGDNGTKNDETWMYDYGSNQWTKSTHSTKPSPRVGHTLTNLGGESKVILYGGNTGSHNNETWVFDAVGDYWSQMYPKTKPERLVGHAMAYVSGTDQVVLFGGQAEYGAGSYAKVDETWEFDVIAQQGTYTSSAFDTSAHSSFYTINWNEAQMDNNDGLSFQFRTADDQTILLTKEFVGPDGTTESYYDDHPEEDLWTEHTGDQWMQYKAYFTLIILESPELSDVEIDYNCWPDRPTLINPTAEAILTDNTPTFSWNFKDVDSTMQSAFHLLIDDSSDFSSVNYNSDVQYQTISQWDFPTGTSYSAIADGTWYWKVRTQDTDGDWGPYSSHRKFIMDTTPPEDFIIEVDPPGWSNNNQPQITFNTTDSGSGIDYYKLKIGTGGFSEETSPYTLPELTDGLHSVAVRAYDKAGHFTESTVEILIDTTLPDAFTPTTATTEWSRNDQPEISFTTDDSGSGIDHYEMSVDAGTFSQVTSPVTLEPLKDGEHDIVIKAYDLADNFVEGELQVKVDTISPAITHTPVESGTKGYVITLNAIVDDAHSGIDKVNLFFKKPTDVTYTSSLMNFEADMYTSELASNTVTEEGLEYYIRALDRSSPVNEIYFGSDGLTSIEPGSLTDIDITVTESDITPPTITHIPPSEIFAGEGVPITATITDDASGVDYVELYYRKTTDTLYTKTSMAQNVNKYTAEIPGSVVTTAGVQYYIKAADSAVPPNLAFFTAAGQVDTEPDPDNKSGIEIKIQEKDTTPPTVINNYPTGFDVNVGTTIYVTFSEEMDHTATLSAFIITPMITGETNWDGNQLAFTPDIALEYNTTYSISVNTKAKDLAGNFLASEYSWDFTTTSTQDVTYPTIIDKLPEGNDVPVDTTISVAFSEPMRKEEVELAFSVVPTISGTYNWVGTTLIFTPRYPLDYDTVYSVSIASTAKDLVGNNLENDYTWAFTTTGIYDKTPPTVIDRVPFGINVPVDTSISVAFSEQMMQEETRYAFSIYPSINGIFDWLGTTLTFIPTEQLAYEQQYNVTITMNAKDLVGNTLEQNYTWEFVTEKAPETDDPEIEDLPPEEKESNDISWDFWEPIVTILTIVASLMVGLFGYYRLRKRQSKLRHYFDKIDTTYNDYNKNYQKCENEMVTLRESIKDDVKQGKLEEFHFLVLDKKIDDYLLDMKKAKKNNSKYRKVKGQNGKDKPIDDYANDSYKSKKDVRIPRIDQENPDNPYRIKNEDSDDEPKIRWE